MPKKGYKSAGQTSLPDEIMEAIEKLTKDPRFIREMKMRGFTRISKALVIRLAVVEFLKKWNIIEK